jgi:hypothetical protein
VRIEDGDVVVTSRIVGAGMPRACEGHGEYDAQQGNCRTPSPLVGEGWDGG